MKTKYLKCKYCGKKVFKSYWEGIEMVREYNENNKIDSPHFCSLNYGEKTIKQLCQEMSA